MTIDEAIRELCNIKLERIPIGELGELKALNLGIEALEFFKDLEDRGALPSGARLPGETKD